MAQPDIGDLVVVMRHAADVLERKAQIAREIRALRLEDSRLDAEIKMTWRERVNDMQMLLQGFVSQLPTPVSVPPVDPPPAEEVPVPTTDIPPEEEVPADDDPDTDPA